MSIDIIENTVLRATDHGPQKTHPLLCHFPHSVRVISRNAAAGKIHTFTGKHLNYLNLNGLSRRDSIGILLA